MGLKKISTLLRAAGSAAWNGRKASAADLVLIQQILQQAAAFQYFERYRGAIKNEPLAASALAPSDRVWQLWFQGTDQAPPIVQACLQSVRRHLPGKEITLLDEKNIEDHIALPGHLYDRKRRGQMSNVNFSDVLRAYLLAEHGGTWIDATVYLTEPPAVPFLNLPLFCFSTTPAAMMGGGRTLASSWFLHAGKGNALLAAVRDLFTEFWRHESRCLHHYYFHLLFALAVKESEACRKLWEAVPFYSNIPPHVLQFELFDRFDSARFAAIKRMSAVHKLTHYGGPEFQPEKADTFYRAIIAEWAGPSERTPG